MHKGKDDELRTLWNDKTLTLADIAQRTGIADPRQVARRLGLPDRRGLKSKYGKSYQDKAFADQLATLWSDPHMTLPKICERLNIGERTVTRLARNIGLPDRRSIETHRRSKLDVSRMAELRVMWINNVSFAEMARFFGVTISIIQKKSKRLASVDYVKRKKGIKTITVAQMLQDMLLTQMKQKAAAESAAIKERYGDRIQTKPDRRAA